MMAPATCRGPVAVPPPRLLLLLLALLACATAATGGSVCDSANCGRGHCQEVTGLPLIPSYKCVCDPGWSQAFDAIPISPCTIPNCTVDKSCFNISLTPPQWPPSIPNITTVCFAVNCGPGGACKAGSVPFSFTCECQQGYENVLNLTALPCVKNCKFDSNCAALGLAPPPESPPPPASPGNNDDPSSGAPPAPRPSSKGSVSLQNILHLLLLVSMVAMVQVL